MGYIVAVIGVSKGIRFASPNSLFGSDSDICAEVVPVKQAVNSASMRIAANAMSNAFLFVLLFIFFLFHLLIFYSD